MIKLKDLLNESDDLTTAKAKIIANLTGTRWEKVEDFIYDTPEINSTDLVNYIKKGSLKDRMDFATALSGKPNNKYAQILIKKIGKPRPKYEIKEETGGSAEDFAKRIEEVIKKHFPTSSYYAEYSKNLSESIHIRFAIGKKSDWSGGYWENAPVDYRAMIWGIKGGVTNDRMMLESNGGASVRIDPGPDSYYAFKRLRVPTRKTRGGEEEILRAVEKVMINIKKTTKENLDNFKNDDKWVKKYI